MKKVRVKSFVRILVAMLVLISVTMMSADAQFNIGIKVAGNYANYIQLTKKNFGMEAGVFLRLGNKFFFQPEVNYVLKRSTPIVNTTEFSSDEIVMQHFVAVPLLLGYHIVNKEKFKFRLMIGPRFDFKIADNLSDNDWQSNTVQWGGQLGLGVDVWRFALDFGYCLAADNFRYFNQGTFQTQRMNMFILSLGFKFRK